MRLRLTDEQNAALEELARSQHISKKEAVARAIEATAKNQRAEAEFTSALDDTIGRYPSTMRRLGE